MVIPSVAQEQLQTLLPYVSGISGLEFENPLALKKQFRPVYGQDSWKARHTRTGHKYMEDDIDSIRKFFDTWAWNKQGKSWAGADYSRRRGAHRNAQIPFASLDTTHGKAAAVFTGAESSELVILIEDKRDGPIIFEEIARRIAYADDLIFGDSHRVYQAFSTNKLHGGGANIRIAGTNTKPIWYNIGVNPFT